MRKQEWRSPAVSLLAHARQVLLSPTHFHLDLSDLFSCFGVFHLALIIAGPVLSYALSKEIIQFKIIAVSFVG